MKTSNLRNFTPLKCVNAFLILTFISLLFMEITNIQKVTELRICLKVVILFSFLTLAPSYFSQGEGLFKAKCATCHAVFKNGTGPKLYEARKRWEDAGEGEYIYEWVRNNASLRASGKSSRANEIFQEYKGSVMSAFPDPFRRSNYLHF